MTLSVKFYGLNLACTFLSLLLQLGLYSALSSKDNWLYDKLTSGVTSLRDLKVFRNPAVMLDINFDEGLIVENFQNENNKPEDLVQTTFVTCRKCLWLVFMLMYIFGIFYCVFV